MKSCGTMKRLLLFAGISLMCGHITAAEAYATTPSDSTRTKMEIKKMDFKATGNVNLGKKERETPPAADKALKVEKSDIKSNLSPIEERLPESEKRSSAEEIKDMARREGNRPVKKATRPAVSYPSYPGGNVAIREFVRKNQQYPQECKRERLTGRVEVLIAIAPDGTPHSATISKSSGNVHMDAEALRVAELMPKWTPAAESDDPQSIDYVIFVNFRPGR